MARVGPGWRKPPPSESQDTADAESQDLPDADVSDAVDLPDAVNAVDLPGLPERDFYVFLFPAHNLGRNTSHANAVASITPVVLARKSSQSPPR